MLLQISIHEVSHFSRFKFLRWVTLVLTAMLAHSTIERLRIHKSVEVVFRVHQLS